MTRLVIAFGGGVIGDIAGFAAATYMRGVDWIGVPTTLLSMVDSAIGGKVGINHPRAKNIIGAFHQPRAVVAILRCCDTLPRAAAAKRRLRDPEVRGHRRRRRCSKPSPRRRPRSLDGPASRTR